MFNNLTPVVKNLLIITIGMFVLSGFLSFNIVGIAALYNPISGNFQPWQFFTYMFLHGGLGHLFGNMFALFIFGPLLERFWGSNRFLIFYLVTGVGAGVIYAGVNYLDMRSMKQDMEIYMTNPSPDAFSRYVGSHASGLYRNLYDIIDQYERNPQSAQLERETKQYVQLIYERSANIPMIGASGAIFGILAAFALLFPNTELFLLFFPFPIKAKYFVGFYLLYELYAEFNRTPGDNIAHLAHLAGALIAFVLLRLWRKERNRFY
jgi:membrane associated rhomboid family serine protease